MSDDIAGEVDILKRFRKKYEDSPIG